MNKFIVFIVSFFGCLYLELTFKLISGLEFINEYIYLLFILALVVSFILSLLTNFFNSKTRKIILYLFLFVLGVFFVVQYCLNKIYGFYFQLSTLGLADQAAAFAGDGIKIFFDNCPTVLLFFVPLVISFIVLFKKDLIKTNLVINIIGTLICLIVYLTIFIVNSDLYKSVSSNMSISINKVGVINSFNVDLVNYCLGYEEEEILVDEPIEESEPIIEEKTYNYHTLDFDFDALLNDYAGNKQVVDITNYIMSQNGTKENDYTGLFEGKNLIWIMAESFNSIAITPELTPTLYRLTHSGFQFENFYTPTVMSTIGGEFSQLTSFYPDMSSSPTTLATFRNGTNYFPFGLSTIFEEEGYTTYAYHDNLYNFQDRDKYLAALGFDNYLGCWNGLEERINCRIWPESDIEMVENTVGDFINDEKFMVFYVFVSGHGDYTFNEKDNDIGTKYEDIVKEYYGQLSSDSYVNDKLLAYVANMIEEDRALEKLINELAINNRLNDTVIVFAGDHHPYYLTQSLSNDDYNLLSDYYRDGKYEIYHSDLIIYNPSVHDTLINKVGATMDILPTVYNLFGLDYDSRLMMGKDILSDDESYVITNDHSWISNTGKYNAYKETFTPNNENDEYDSDAVDATNKKVKNAVLMSKYIMTNDYYNILWKYKIEKEEEPIQQ